MRIALAAGKAALAAILIVVMSGCASWPGGVASSTTPIDGRAYDNLGRVTQTSSRYYLFGWIPITTGNWTRDAIDKAVRQRGGDAMVDVTVDGMWQWWIIVTRMATRVEGNVIRFRR